MQCAFKWRSRHRSRTKPATALASTTGRRERRLDQHFPSALAEDGLGRVGVGRFKAGHDGDSLQAGKLPKYEQRVLSRVSCRSWHYWIGAFVAANAFIGLNLVGELLLGMLVGYERLYNGRAAGMRLYGLVCMASTALTVFVGQTSFWYGGTSDPVTADPARVVQGVVTGMAF